jgi:hypothetical protein
MMIWLTLMMTNWWLLLRPRPHVARFGLALLTVNALTWPACHAMWAIAPRDDYWGSADPPPYPVPDIWWAVLAFFLFPFICTIAAQWFRGGASCGVGAQAGGEVSPEPISRTP